MKISEQWLREWVDPALDSNELAHCLTMAGLEVKGLAAVAGEFSGVVVAEIVSREPHPDADRLSLCQVNSGSATVRIVCGAANARAGLKAPLAQVGAVLPGQRKIGRARLRGVESQGMLCAGDELGLGDTSEGLLELPADAPLGADLRNWLGLDDRVLELELTPNRADCLSVRGLARELGLLTNSTVKDIEIQEIKETISDVFPVEISAGASCPRYLCRVLRGIDRTRPSPLWLQERLRRSGLRSIDAVVDVTNYVLLELGQPMHAFDLASLHGGIRVRMARSGESLQLLDGQTAALAPDSLVIADHNGAVALAGIMGGRATAVGAGTTDILLEAAFFAPLAMMGQARRYGLHTDASHRFERGVDFNLQRQAMERASQLLLDVVGGAAGPITEVTAAAHLPTRATVPLRRERIQKLLGCSMEDSSVEHILGGLGLAVQRCAAGWQLEVPAWRFDIAIEADLLEELARVHGYSRLPASRIRADLVLPPRPEQQLSLRALRYRLIARGYWEAVTYSFVERQWQQAFDPQLEPVALSNPISPELAVMRSSLLPGLLTALLHNTARQQSRVRLFESGLRFLPGAAGLEQRPALAAIISGARQPESWTEQGEQVDFYDIKGDLEALLCLTGAEHEFRFVAAAREGLHPGQTAALYRGAERLGYVGALHPQLQARCGLAAPAYGFEIDLEALLQARLPTFAGLSKYPELRRDIAVSVDKAVPAGEVLAAVRSAAGKALTGLRLFDVYEGEGIDPERKSLALGLTFQAPTRTLDDADVNKIIDQVLDLLIKTYKAELRG